MTIIQTAFIIKKMKPNSITTLGLCLMWLLSILVMVKPVYAQHANVTLVRYYDDPRDVVINGYYYKLLEMALKKTEKQYGPFKLELVMKHQVARDVLRHLRVGDGVDVVSSNMSLARAWVLRAVKVPLTKGYIGCRLIMVNQADKNMFKNVMNAEQLNKFRLGQEYDWPDVQILEENGVHVVTTQTYDSLFTMLANHAIDGFPRGVYEIASEIKERPKMHFAIANGIYLKYPEDFFFYVKKDNLALAKRIKEGLLAGKKDGSFDRIFREDIQPLIDAAHLGMRRMIKMSNPDYIRIMKDDRSGEVTNVR